MTAASVPTIFSRRRAIRNRQRMLATGGHERALFVLDDAIDEVIDRLEFIRMQPSNGLIVGDVTKRLSAHLAGFGGEVTAADIILDNDGIELELERPYPSGEYDFVAVLGLLHAVNDLPGALIHIRNALTPGGLMIASFVGGASLPRLRSAMLAAEPDRPAARIHPMVDPRAAPGLLQRAGLIDPVVDTHTLKVRYNSLDTLVSDLRDQALGSALNDPGPPLGKAARERARTAFLHDPESDGKVTEILEIVTLTGRRSA